MQISWIIFLMRLSEANKLRVLYFLVFCCTAAWLPIFADYCKTRGLNGIETGIVLSITPLMMFVVQPFYGMLADRFGYRKTLIFSSFLASICYALYLFEGGFSYLLLITVFMAIFYNTLQPVLDSLSLKLVKINYSPWHCSWPSRGWLPNFRKWADNDWLLYFSFATFTKFWNVCH